MYYLKLSLVFIFVIFIWSCKKDNEEPVLQDTALGGAFLATIEGLEFTATQQVYGTIVPNGENSTICIVRGIDLIGDTCKSIQVTIYDYKGTGTYEIGSPTRNLAFFATRNMATNTLESSYRADKDAPQKEGTGKLKITSITSERINGTFEFTGISDIGESKFIKGQFSAKL